MSYKKYINCTSGATAIEYAIIATGIAMAIMFAVYAFGGDLGLLYDEISTATTGP